MKRSIFVIVVLMLVLASIASVVSAQEEVVLKVWDNYFRQANDQIIKDAMEKFKQKHPNVSFQRVARPLDDLKMQIMAALPKGQGPDIMTVNNAETMMGPLVRGGHLLALDKYAEEYNWEDKILSPAVMNRARYSEDGTVLGKGNLYAVPFMGELVGVYYNKEIFEELDLNIPQSLEEFEEVLKTLKDAGYIPITYGGLDDWQFFHLYGEVLGSVLAHDMGADNAQEYLDDIVLRWDEDRSFVNKSTQESASILQEWVENDYFVDGFSGLNGDDALPIFTAGKAAIFIQGSWYSGDITVSDIEAGFFPFPPYKKDGKLPPQVGGMLVPYGISAYTEHPDLAAEFIDIVISSESTNEHLIDNNSLPASVPVDTSELERGTLKYDIYTTWNEVNDSGRLGHYLDWISSSMWDTMGEAGQNLMNLDISPVDFVEKIETDFRQWQDEKPKAD
ncbi:extracellular solute-binding protein [Halanaerobium kushneri]|uniref:Carbohydrate ABC transporter substrate-binding protein, CUT1 family n=1 Tax=Halanaerobium kushneri TaxID=56779 RepID=A0A1N6R2H0_9FIRM|nr:extracellular solute-binding protein [Halanaerobium kushneri]SIQ23058.1 carbohydrate ABC transporter substrate-binding protein, CUT1 family [Halanaerobium kushneri]